MSANGHVTIAAAGIPYRELNVKIHQALDVGVRDLELTGVRGQRYIGAGVTVEARIDLDGVPGNDLACFMSGPRIVVRANAQDGVANTMSAGTVVVHGHVGDVLGYSMRGGKVLVRGNAGYRVGIHMKAFRERVPVVMIGGTVADYLGEYMAGGTLIVLGLGRKPGEPLAGEFIGTGMHGGEIYLNGQVEPWQLGRELGRGAIDERAWRSLKGHLDEFSKEFGVDPGQFEREHFTRLIPVSHRPYGKIYVY